MKETFEKKKKRQQRALEDIIHASSLICGVPY